MSVQSATNSTFFPLESKLVKKPVLFISGAVAVVAGTVALVAGMVFTSIIALPIAGMGLTLAGGIMVWQSMQQKRPIPSPIAPSPSQKKEKLEKRVKKEEKTQKINAKKEFEKALDKARGAPYGEQRDNAFRQLGEDCFSKGNFKNALEAVRWVSNSEVRDPFRMKVAEAYFAKGDFKNALEAVRWISDSEVRDPFRLKVAQACLEKGEYHQSIEAVKWVSKNEAKDLFLTKVALKCEQSNQFKLMLEAICEFSLELRLKTLKERLFRYAGHSDQKIPEQILKKLLFSICLEECSKVNFDKSRVVEDWTKQHDRFEKEYFKKNLTRLLVLAKSQKIEAEAEVVEELEKAARQLVLRRA